MGLPGLPKGLDKIGDQIEEFLVLLRSMDTALGELLELERERASRERLDRVTDARHDAEGLARILGTPLVGDEDGIHDDGADGEVWRG